MSVCNSHIRDEKITYNVFKIFYFFCTEVTLSPFLKLCKATQQFLHRLGNDRVNTVRGWYFSWPITKLPYSDSRKIKGHIDKKQVTKDVIQFQLVRPVANQNFYKWLCRIVEEKFIRVRTQPDTTHIHHRSRICRQTPTTQIISTFEPLYVISVKYRLSLPDDGSYVIWNMLE